MDNNKDWKEDQKNYSRSAFVKLINKTGQTLFRQQADVIWGVW